jgi:hypothetical protein
MKKRIMLSVVWAIALPVIYFLASMLMFALLGLLGMGKLQPPEKITGWWTVFAVAGSVWAWLCLASPIIGFALAFFGRLPGTRPKKKEVPA